MISRQGIENSGSWEASGAFSGSGTLSGFDFGNRSVTRTLVSAEGTIRFQITFLTLVFGDTGFTETDRWVIFSGTGAYAGLRAQGTGQGAATFSGDPTCPSVIDGHGVATGRVTRL